MESAVTFRAKSSYLFAAIGAVLCLIALWSGIVVGGVRNIFTVALWDIAALSFLYLSFIKPKVEIGDEGIIVTNPVRTSAIGWSEVIDIGAKWNLYIQTADRTINAWAAPAPSRRHNRKIHASEVRGMKSADNYYISPAVSPRSESGVALHLAEIRWHAFQSKKNNRTLLAESTNDWRVVALLVVALVCAMALTLY